jgi:hypothetical protein
MVGARSYVGRNGCGCWLWISASARRSLAIATWCSLVPRARSRTMALFKASKPTLEGQCLGTAASTITGFSSMTTSSSSTATTTMYASPSRAFLMRPVDLLD